MIVNKREVTKRFEAIKKSLVSAVLSEISGATHIILYGSYGRSEGGWFYEEGKVHPYNDFDLLLVVDEKFNYTNDINAFRVGLAEKVGVRWVDITLTTRKDLGKTKNSVFGYDLKYGSTVIYGDPKILEAIPPLKNNIDLEEGEILFFTRLWTFTGSIDAIRALSGDESRFFRNQMAKAIFSIIDVILLMENKYDSSYEQRLRMVSTQVDCKLSEKALGRFQWALAERSVPKDFKMTAFDVQDLYLSVAELYRHFMLILLSKRHKKNFKTISEFNKFYRYSAYVNAKRLAYCLIKMNNKFEKTYFTNIIQMNVLAALLSEIDEGEAVSESLIFLNKIGYSLPHMCDMNGVKSKVSEIRVNM